MAIFSYWLDFEMMFIILPYYITIRKKVVYRKTRTWYNRKKWM